MQSCAVFTDINSFHAFLVLKNDCIEMLLHSGLENANAFFHVIDVYEKVAELRNKCK